MGTKGNPKTHRKRAEIIHLINEGLTNAEIGRRLRVERQMVGLIRKDIGARNVPAQPLSLEEKWATLTTRAEGGHLDWTGERQKQSGTPILRYKEQAYTAAQVAFRIKHGHAPEGYVYAECGYRHCVAPDHVDDQRTRTQGREQLRYLTGGRKRAERCRHGHDQSQWGRYETDGRAYCHRCKLAIKSAQQSA